MKIQSIFVISVILAECAVVCFANESETVAEVDWHGGVTPPSSIWLIEPEDPNINDIINFSGPTGCFSNAICAEVWMMGYRKITIDFDNKTVELWFEPPGPGTCPAIWDPVSGLVGRFGPLAEGDWLFFSESFNPHHPSFRIGFHVSAIKVIEPNGGESLPAGSTYTINWADFRSDGNCPGNYLLDYSSDNAQNWTAVEPNVVSNTCTYDWVVPAINSEECLIQIVDANDPNISDISDATFTIYECTLSYDLNNDCVVDFLDLALLTLEWLQCGNPFDPN